MNQPTIRLGNRGAAVLEARRLLLLHGCSNPKSAHDPSFDVALKVGVKAFQAGHELTIDGIVGPKTWAKLEWAPAVVTFYYVKPNGPKVVMGKKGLVFQWEPNADGVDWEKVLAFREAEAPGTAYILYDAEGELRFLTLATFRDVTGQSVKPPAGPRRINAAGRALLVLVEGRKLEVYLDSAGHPTVGIGHKLTSAEIEKWPVGTRFSGKFVDALFETDLTPREVAVEALVRVPLSSNQFAALVSFVFNLGAESLKRSTLLKKLNARDYAGAAGQFEKWDKARQTTGPKKGQKVKLPGLYKRRQAERALFLKADG